MAVKVRDSENAVRTKDGVAVAVDLVANGVLQTTWIMGQNGRVAESPDSRIRLDGKSIYSKYDLYFEKPDYYQMIKVARAILGKPRKPKE